MMKRIICLALLASLLVSLLACAGESGVTDDTTKSGGTPEDTAAPDGTTIYYEPDGLPDTLNFGGKKIYVLTALENDFTVEELTSEPVNDSLYYRERYVEDRLGVEIEEVYKTGSSYENEINRQINSGEDTTDIFSYSGFMMSGYIFDGYLFDLYEVDNLDLSRPWWSRKFNDETEIEDSLYMATGSVTLSLLRNIFAVYFNKRAADSYSGAYPDLADLYAIVQDGKWTFDKFLELGGDIYEDLNGNQITDVDDFYGINYHKWVTIDAMWSGFDLNVLSKDDEGWYEFDVNTDKLFAALDMMDKLLNNTKGCTSNKGIDMAHEDVGTVFANGQNLFMVGMLGLAEEPALRNMTDDYGILPYPKYDLAQKEYYSYSYDEYRVFSIPVTNEEPEIAGAVLEAMASYSYRNTSPIYLDQVLKGKYMSDANSRRSVDILVDGFMLDAAWVYIDTLTNKYTPLFRNMIMDGDTNWASEHQSRLPKIKFYLKYYKEQFEKNNHKVQ